MPMYQPYNQPLYGQTYNNYYPYQVPQYQTLQQPMTQPHTNLNGKVIQSVDNITANDVPMDGSIAIFPKQDMSEIYAKSWNADGTIRTIVYKPYTAAKPDTVNSTSDASKLKIGLSDETTEAFMKRFDALEKRFDELSAKVNIRKSNGSTKKEVEVE